MCRMFIVIYISRMIFIFVLDEMFITKITYISILDEMFIGRVIYIFILDQMFIDRMIYISILDQIYLTEWFLKLMNRILISRMIFIFYCSSNIY